MYNQSLYLKHGTLANLLKKGESRRLLSQQDNQARITVALYRQLLQWSNSVKDDVPLNYYIPPVYLSPPRIDRDTLRLMSVKSGDSKVAASIFPKNTIVKDDQLVVPIRNSADVKKLFRGVFRLNSKPANPDKQKERISVAFDGLKSLNELSKALEDLGKEREKHLDRENVKYHVGQVVRHKLEEWRGVIIGWKRLEGASGKDPTQLTSLTTKEYALDAEDSIKYSIVLDVGDAHLHYAKRREGGNMAVAEVLQTDLELVEEEELLRIRSSNVSEFFTRFDSASKSFVPNEILEYEYPKDTMISTSAPTQLSDATEAAAEDIIMGVKETAAYMRSIIMGYSSAPESRNLKILGFFLEKLDAILEGDVLEMKDKLFNKELPSNRLAALHLQQLLNFIVNVGELLWERRRARENTKENKFGLGDIVTHKVYGFRGVVVAWDPEPMMDVSMWDGLQHIDNPQDYPFYHIIPDHNDCIEAFGAERPSRYVCEENLVVCPSDQRSIDVDLDTEWRYDLDEKKYLPPLDLKFKSGVDLEDDGITEACLTELRDALSQVLVACREGEETGNPDINEITTKMSMANVLILLKSAEDMELSTIISESVKEIWKAHLNPDLRWDLDTAVAHLLGGKVSKALKQFSEIVDDDPTYAEAWNKASTCEFMMGNMDASLAAAQKTVEALPTHFQAMNGLGLVHFEKKDLPSAIHCFRESMEIDPWSPVSARLSVCVDTMRLSEQIQGNQQEDNK
ncbi:unnamed protein product [Cylindrotheca closterium]|uniref:Hemimethylated DNA-binding domain-containing protein n=1 Tax=Cylindrotheca closterium TaxID=2856 RepID=A0AAD2FXX2_9STRA|nr:unnamed protein product [Cylindrotheca closterium]